MDRIVRLVNEYVGVLDRKEVEGWAALFAREAGYYVIPRDNLERGLPLAIVYDDSRSRIEDRVDYIRKVWHGHYDDYQPRHMVSTIVVTPMGAEEFSVSANFAVYATELEGTTALLAVGEYRDVVVIEDGVPRFKEKRVILDTSVLARYFVYPL